LIFITHIVSPKSKQNRDEYARRCRSFASIYSDPKAKLATAEEIIAAMDKDGVDISVVLNYGWSTQPLCAEVNDYILESVGALSQVPGRFLQCRPVEDESALKEVERCIKNGAKGIGELRLDDHLRKKHSLAMLKTNYRYYYSA